MLSKMILLMPGFSQYGVLHHFTIELAAALRRQNIAIRLIEQGPYQLKEVVKEIYRDPPDCTLCFNGVLPNEDGHFICDDVKIPHVACLVDPPTHFAKLSQSKYTLISCIDRYFCDYFSTSKAGQVFFMPHAVSKELHAPADKPRRYPLVFLGSFFDPDEARNTWLKKYPPRIAKLIDAAAEITLAENETSFIVAFLRTLNEDVVKQGPIDLHLIDHQIFDLLETYIKGIDRIALLRAIQGEHQLHLFGTGEGWKKALPRDVVIHGPVPFEAALEIMKESKIVLNSCLSFKDGSHERLFSAMACGAVVCTNENRYQREQFKEGEELLFYQSSHREEINDSINRCLNDESLRCRMANQAYEKVKREHTWDNRAQLLLEQLPSMILDLIETS